jgi:phenylpropionate dioxygenase-like ring-hydroxylating dioxygenase large terminal subunit
MQILDYARYYKPSFFDQENEKLFSKLWVYGCSVADLPKTNTYFLAKMPFGEVIISRDGDKFYAFHNKCLHRGHPVVTKLRGESNFACPYHQWCYAKNGGLTHIPGDEDFYLTNKEEYTFERLQPVALKRLGDFLFINASENPIRIEDQFDSNIIENLEKTKDMLSVVSISLSINLKFNWKLIFENLRDPLHPMYLHPTSLTQEVDFYATQNKPIINNEPIRNLIEISNFSRDGDLRNMTAPYKADFIQCDSGENYLNWLLFPFTHIPCPDGGVLYSVENYVPINAENTRFDLSLFITKSIGKTSPIAVLYDWLMKAKIVLSEDFEAVCALQERIKQSDQMQNLGVFEQQNYRINNFLDTYIYEKNN